MGATTPPNSGPTSPSRPTSAPRAVDDATRPRRTPPLSSTSCPNDSDPDTDPIVVDSVTQGTNGSVVNNGTDVTYTPNASWSGIDTFTYTIADGKGGLDTATVTVT